LRSRHLGSNLLEPLLRLDDYREKWTRKQCAINTIDRQKTELRKDQSRRDPCPGTNSLKVSAYVRIACDDRSAWRIEEYAYLSAYCESVLPSAAFCSEMRPMTSTMRSMPERRSLPLYGRYGIYEAAHCGIRLFLFGLNVRFQRAFDASTLKRHQLFLCKSTTS
jgi:hypothetical protein